MSSPNYGTPPRGGPYTCGRGFVYDKPSPLSVVKYDNNVSREIYDATDHSKYGSVKYSQVVRGDGALAIAKKRKLDPERAAAGKENLRILQHDKYPSSQGDRTLRDSKDWVQQHDSPPRRLLATPSPQLSVRKRRQTRTHARVQPGQSNTSSPFSSDTLPVGYELRRPVKTRPPLSNICDEIIASKREPPSKFHATGQGENYLPITGCPPLAPSENLTTPQQPRSTWLLTPHVSITPEVNALEKGCHRLWVAIEISTGPWFAPERKVQPGARREQPDLMDLAAEDPSEPDGLYDLDVQILPTAQSSVIRVLQSQSFPVNRLKPESSVFLLAQMQIDVAREVQNKRHECPQYESDDLIKALERELGDSTVKYMTVRLSYRHSAFPTSQDIGIADNGMFSIHSKIETVATASVRLHNAMSIWSPPLASTSNPLLPLIERHWGVTNANEAMRHIMTPDYVPWESGKVSRSIGTKPKDAAPRSHIQAPLDQSPAPLIPLRHASLQRSRNGDNDDDKAASSHSRQKVRRESSRCDSSASTCMLGRSQEVSLTLRTSKHAGAGNPSAEQAQETEFSRREIDFPAVQDRRSCSGNSDSSTLWKRRSLGAETLRGLFPLMAGLSTTRSREVKRGPMRDEELGAVSPAARTRGKKDASRWGWATWF
ncbi:hypothetical protein FSARC_7259 [Fusarium sarcochroum]|uniref:Uncharacterized protein n=1 Tax=Fusarium sarcochroum TaxID=1208366 RepID=A0A8H4TVN4_9HYPO|nr:hypothetical protein FSARC_7259 [Fusarium sarcochroum]